MKRLEVLVVLCLALFVGRADAQFDPEMDSATSTTTPVPPPPPKVTREMVEEPPPVELVRDEPEAKVGFTWALQVGVPIFLDVDRDVTKAGGDVSFLGAADFGYFVIGGIGGVGWNRIDLNNQTMIPIGGKSPLSRVFLSLPEVRVQVPNLKRILPYVGASFDMNFWNFRETDLVCGFYYCTNSSVYRFTPGFTVRGGAGIEVVNHVYVDFGLRYSYTGKGNFFNQSRQWLTPFVGVLVRGR